MPSGWNFYCIHILIKSSLCFLWNYNVDETAYHSKIFIRTTYLKYSRELSNFQFNLQLLKLLFCCGKRIRNQQIQIEGKKMLSCWKEKTLWKEFWDRKRVKKKGDNSRSYWTSNSNWLIILCVWGRSSFQPSPCPHIDILYIYMKAPYLAGLAKVGIKFLKIFLSFARVENFIIMSVSISVVGQ